MARTTSFKSLVLIAGIVAIPATGAAQTQAPPPVPSSLSLPPGLAFSTAAGGVWSASQRVPGGYDESAAFAVSIEGALNRYMVGQGEMLFNRVRLTERFPGAVVQSGAIQGYTGDRLVDRHETRVDFIGNLLGRVGHGRVHGTFGAGFGVSFADSIETGEIVGCRPWAPGACDVRGGPFRHERRDLLFVHQWVAGVDVRVTDRMAAFGSYRYRVTPAQESYVFAGVRVTVRQRPISVGWHSRTATGTVHGSIGREVHVVAYDNTRKTGTLVSIDARSLVINKRGHSVSIPITEIKGIRRTSHAIRRGTIIGAATGVATGLLLCLAYCEDGDDAYALAFASSYGLLGAGIGAAIGSAINLSTAASRTLYFSPAPTGITVRPIAGRGRLGAVATVGWQ